MTINIEHYEYYEDTTDAGIRLIIHDENETPVRFRGLSLAPGFTTNVEVTKQKVGVSPGAYLECKSNLCDGVNIYDPVIKALLHWPINL